MSAKTKGKKRSDKEQLSLFDLTEEVEEPIVEEALDPEIIEPEKEYLKTSEALPEFFERDPSNPFLWYWLQIKGVQPGDMISYTEAQKWLESEVEELRKAEGLQFDDMTISIEGWKENLEARVAKKLPRR